MPRPPKMVPHDLMFPLYVPLNPMKEINRQVTIMERLLSVVPLLDENEKLEVRLKKIKTRERKKDEINRLTHIHKKKVEMELAREAGIKAVKNKWMEKRANAVALKKEGAKKIAKMEKKLAKQLKQKQINKAEIKKNIFIKAKIKK